MESSDPQQPGPYASQTQEYGALFLAFQSLSRHLKIPTNIQHTTPLPRIFRDLWNG